MADKMKIWGKLRSQEEIEAVFLKAKKLSRENKVYREELAKRGLVL